MTLYLTRFSYTPETWARLSNNPENRREAAAPDNVSMAAVSIAISGGGALAKFETTVLLSVEETIEALKRVQTITYRQPGA